MKNEVSALMDGELDNHEAEMGLFLKVAPLDLKWALLFLVV